MTITYDIHRVGGVVVVGFGEVMGFLVTWKGAGLGLWILASLRAGHDSN